MNFALRSIVCASALLLISAAAFAVAIPEIDGALIVQALALVAGVGLMVKRRQ